jgi:hypothetical protein
VDVNVASVVTVVINVVAIVFMQFLVMLFLFLFLINLALDRGGSTSAFTAQVSGCTTRAGTAEEITKQTVALNALSDTVSAVMGGGAGDGQDGDATRRVARPAA